MSPSVSVRRLSSTRNVSPHAGQRTSCRLRSERASGLWQVGQRTLVPEAGTGGSALIKVAEIGAPRLDIESRRSGTASSGGSEAVEGCGGDGLLIDCFLVAYLTPDFFTGSGAI